jgi:hypothetical protein
VAAEKEKNELPAKVKAILDKADQLELLSLDPDSKKPKAKDDYHGWHVLGTTVVKKAEVRKLILEALVKGIAESEEHGAKCFEPGHGIQATSGGKTVDLVICFECKWVDAYFGDEKVTKLVTTWKPRTTLDKVLTDAKVPLPKVLMK